MALTQVTPDVLHNIQSNVTQVGTLSNLSVTGNITSGNVTATNFTGTASLANNASFLGGTAAASYALGSTVITANTNMKGYTDGQITIVSNSVTGANAAITTANTNMKGYADAITTAWTANAGAQAGSIASTNTALTTANTNMKGYADAITTAWTANAGAQAGSIASTNTALTTANTNMKGYADAITTAWTANAAVQAGAIATINAGAIAKGYISFEPTTAVPFASKNLYVTRTAPGHFTITLDASIQNGTVNYAPMVSAINKGQIVAMGFGPDAMDVYGVGVTSVSATSFTVVSTRNFDGGIGFYGGGNDGNNVHNFETAALESVRITVVVF
jgi:hypothetical protein